MHPHVSIHVLGSFVFVSVQCMLYMDARHAELLHLQWVYGSMGIVLYEKEYIARHGVCMHILFAPTVFIVCMCVNCVDDSARSFDRVGWTKE